jgi:penicillin-binding protein 1C
MIAASRAVYAQGGELLRVTLASDGQYRLWVPLASISPLLVDAVLAYEDRHFYWHPGVNPASLLRSAWSSAGGARRLGGSTLTMQLARRLYAIDSRSIGGKMAQSAAALWLELRYSKRELLEAYLNTAPYGGNIEGVGAASLIYFAKSAQSLGLPEALTLAVIPQNPRKRIAAGGRNPQLQQARQRLWALWAARDPQVARHAPEVALTLDAQGRANLPMIAPHATDMLLAQYKGQREIRSTLALPMQRTLERVMAQYLATRSDAGLNNASALLLDAKTMQVRAVVGSADHRNEAIAGQVNGTLAKRSPGSTLKPFIYALALDQGLLHPRTVLKDAPTSFGPFSPENFDGRFAGPIPAQEALIRSRNVPAVALAARLRQPGLYDFMKLAGVERLKSEPHYGLALALGGAEVTMGELAAMYATLANGGISRRLAYTRNEAFDVMQRPALQLLSPEAAFITLDMLRQTPRPDTARPAHPAIAWKTGTSWAFRDAWTAGVFGRHVLVVWVGHFDGASNPALIGIEAAAPLFLRMVDALRAQQLDGGETDALLPPNLQKVEVCAATGGLPDALCPVRANTWFIAGKSPILPSALHQAVWVDERSGQPVCGPQAHARREVVEHWSSDMQQLFKQSGLPRRMLAAANCPNGQPTVENAPVITSPLRGVRYSMRIKNPQPLLLHAEAEADVKTLFWFADDVLIARAKPGESVPWQPALPRKYVLRAVDDQGRAQARDVSIELVP